MTEEYELRWLTWSKQIGTRLIGYTFSYTG